VRQGYAALVSEQRCFGEREQDRPPHVVHADNRCHHAAMTAFPLDRTMIGKRVWDVSRAIDVLGEFPEIDARRITCRSAASSRSAGAPGSGQEIRQQWPQVSDDRRKLLKIRHLLV
jgi:cephalosporin-C deacetylase-like acetyl esterase